MISVKKIFKAIKDFEKLVKFAAVDVNAPKNISEALGLLKINPLSFTDPAQEIDEALLKRIFRRQVALTHPDRGGDAKLFNRIKSAYEYLIERKKLYPEEFKFEIDSIINQSPNQPPGLGVTPDFPSDSPSDSPSDPFSPEPSAREQPVSESPAAEPPRTRSNEPEFVPSDDYHVAPTRGERAGPGTRTKTVKPTAQPGIPHGTPIGTPHALPAAPAKAAPTNKSKALGGAFVLAGITQVLVDQFRKSSNLIEAAESIESTLKKYNKDYGFGDIQQEANQLSSNIREIINLFPKISNASVAAQDANAVTNFVKDANQFIKTLSELDQEITLVYSYLIEHKSWGTRAVNILEGVGISLGYETNTKSLLRTLSEFQSFAASHRFKLEDYLNELNSKVKENTASKPRSKTVSQSVPQPYASDAEVASKPTTKAKAKPKFTSEVEEFANMNF